MKLKLKQQYISIRIGKLLPLRLNQTKEKMDQLEVFMKIKGRQQQF